MLGRHSSNLRVEILMKCHDASRQAFQKERIKYHETGTKSESYQCFCISNFKIFIHRKAKGQQCISFLPKVQSSKPTALLKMCYLTLVQDVNYLHVVHNI